MSKLSETTAKKYITPIEEAEMTIRMIEAFNGMRRPKGSTAVQAMENLDSETCVRWRMATKAAMDYWRECIENLQPVS